MTWSDTPITGTNSVATNKTPLNNAFTYIAQTMDNDHGWDESTSADDGKHKFVTSIEQTSIPSTTGEPILYGFEQDSNLGIFQYSRGISDAVPTPITALHSAAAGDALAGSSSINIYDFSGISRGLAIFMANATIATRRSVAYVAWNGTNLYVDTAVVNGITPSASTNTLILSNNGSTALTIHWSLYFLRTA